MPPKIRRKSIFEADPPRFRFCNRCGRQFMSHGFRRCTRCSFETAGLYTPHVAASGQRRRMKKAGDY